MMAASAMVATNVASGGRARSGRIEVVIEAVKMPRISSVSRVE